MINWYLLTTSRRVGSRDRIGLGSFCVDLSLHPRSIIMARRLLDVRTGELEKDIEKLSVINLNKMDSSDILISQHV